MHPQQTPLQQPSMPKAANTGFNGGSHLKIPYPGIYGRYLMVKVHLN